MNRTLKLVVPAVAAVVMLGCGSTKTAAPVVKVGPIASAAVDTSPSAKTASGWAGKWCQATMGMTRAELIALMGPPTHEAANGESISWFAFEWGFNAFFSSDGTTNSLETAGHPTAAQLAAIPCAEIRKLP